MIIWLYSTLSTYRQTMLSLIRKILLQLMIVSTTLPIAFKAIIAALTPALSVIIAVFGPVSSSKKIKILQSSVMTIATKNCLKSYHK
jgi:hypothetical protein